MLAIGIFEIIFILILIFCIPIVGLLLVYLWRLFEKGRPEI
jgi:hypothetical protein